MYIHAFLDDMFCVLFACHIQNTHSVTCELACKAKAA